MFLRPITVFNTFIISSESCSTWVVIQWEYNNSMHCCVVEASNIGQWVTTHFHLRLLSHPQTGTRALFCHTFNNVLLAKFYRFCLIRFPEDWLHWVHNLLCMRITKTTFFSYLLYLKYIFKTSTNMLHYCWKKTRLVQYKIKRSNTNHLLLVKWYLNIVYDIEAEEFPHYFTYVWHKQI